mmetsp:Transcript_18933/g.46491  ORF Transcript_18933/g.46491 Transcript_18933/m.46491 type:complete len:493 (-) Transcript_18933:457-1935(-)
MPNQCTTCYRYGHKPNNCPQNLNPEQKGKQKKYILVQVARLRSFIHGEFDKMRVPGGGNFDLERVIDDFVFLCIFVGNDFLPHLPGLEIREGALDLLLREYRKVVEKHGYLSQSGEILKPAVRALLGAIAAHERTIVSIRENNHDEREKRKKLSCRFYRPGNPESCRDGNRCRFMHQKPDEERKNDRNVDTRGDGLGKRLSAAAAASYRKLRRSLSEMHTRYKQEQIARKEKTLPLGPGGRKGTLVKDELEEQAQMLAGQGRTLDQLSNMNMPVTEQHRYVKMTFDERVTVELEKAKRQLREQMTNAARKNSSQHILQLMKNLNPHENGFESRYYASKFGFVDSKIKNRICEEYLTGLRWVLQYYHQRCCSWDWFFPFHYAPLAHDMQRLVGRIGYNSSQNYGEPFKPIHQLMAVLPPASGHCLPESYRRLMFKNDSTIIDFYPTSFQIDPDKHKPEWQWVCCLPFIDKDRLLSALKTSESTFTSEESARNT